MKKILIGFLIVLTTPILLILIVASLALFIPAPQCPKTMTIEATALIETLSIELEKSNKVSVSNDEATAVLKYFSGGNIDNFAVCFTKDQLNISGNIPFGKISPSFYVSTNIKSNKNVEATNTKATIGGLGFLSSVIGDIAQKQLNEQLKGAEVQNLYKVQFEEGKATIQISKNIKN